MTADESCEEARASSRMIYAHHDWPGLALPRGVGPRVLSAGDDTPFDGGPPLRVRASSCERNSKRPLRRAVGPNRYVSVPKGWLLRRKSLEPTSGTEWREETSSVRAGTTVGYEAMIDREARPRPSLPVCRKVASSSQPGIAPFGARREADATRPGLLDVHRPALLCRVLSAPHTSRPDTLPTGTRPADGHNGLGRRRDPHRHGHR